MSANLEKMQTEGRMSREVTRNQDPSEEGDIISRVQLGLQSGEAAAQTALDASVFFRP